MTPITAYCVKCRKKNVVISKPVSLVINKKGVPMCIGKCPECGGHINRFVKKSQLEEIAKLPEIENKISRDAAAA